jgi:transposase-like protein
MIQGCMSSKIIAEATPIILTAEERAELAGLVRSTKTEHRTRFKARIILMAAEGAATRAIARALGCTIGTASKWRVRYARDRLAGFSETGNRGPTPKYGPEAGRRILALLDERPPEGYANWTAPLLSAALCDVHEQYIWRFLRAQKIDLSGRKSWCESTDPDFVTKAAEIVGLYMAPPENAIVLAVDEKPSIQALERAQGYLKLPNGRAMTGQSHDYKRHGTTTLFAALDVATGKVIARHAQRRRRVEFLAFMNEIVAAYQDCHIHVVLDNLSTHKPKHDRWLARHKNVTFHYTPPHTSWLNQIESWFSILTGKSLKGASFNALEELKAHIDAFIRSYNETARPFVWTKSKVHQKRLKPCFADQ